MATFSHDFIEELIELLRHESAIWDSKSEQYKNKIEKNKSWSNLLQKYREIDQSATIESVKKKYNSLRACYRRELAKIKKSKKSGASADDVYIPSLWYFNNMDFLRDQEMQVDGINTYDNGTEKEPRAKKPKLSDNYFLGDVHTGRFVEATNRPKCSHISTNRQQINTDKLVKQRRRTRKQSHSFARIFNKSTNVNFDLEKAVSFLEKPTSTPEKDEATIYSESWAIGFRKMDEHQKLFAKRLIDDAILQGQLGNLNMSSYISLGRQSHFIHPSVHYNRSNSVSPYSNGSGLPMTTTGQYLERPYSQSPSAFSDRNKCSHYFKRNNSVANTTTSRRSTIP